MRKLLYVAALFALTSASAAQDDTDRRLCETFSANQIRPGWSSSECIDVLRRAERGDAEAQWVIGVWHRTGPLARRNVARALFWFRQAAVQGHAGARFDLGQIYQDGD